MAVNISLKAGLDLLLLVLYTSLIPQGQIQCFHFHFYTHLRETHTHAPKDQCIIVQEETVRGLQYSQAPQRGAQRVHSRKQESIADNILFKYCPSRMGECFYTS